MKLLGIRFGEACPPTHWTSRGVLSSASEYRENIFRLIDLTVVSLALVVSHYIRFENIEFTGAEIAVSLIFLLLWSVSASVSELYSRSTVNKLGKIYWTSFVTFFSSISLLSIVLLVTHTADSFSRIWFFLGIVIGYISTNLVKSVGLWLIRNGWLNVKSQKVVIVGAGTLGQELARRIESDPYSNCSIAGFFSRSECDRIQGTAGKSYSILGRNSDTELVLEDLRSRGSPIDQVFIAMPSSEIELKLELVRKLSSTQHQVFVVPDYSYEMVTSSRADYVAGLPVVDVTHCQLHGVRASVKRVMDVVISLIGLIVLSPIFLVIGTAIKLDSAGPMVFKQRRYGVGGKEFLVYKFRTMSVSEDGNDVVQAMKHDKRVTKLGGWLRKSSVDETPQLLNVLMGSMSLVGPRPHAVAHNEKYRHLIPGYMRRHAIKPGISGWAQVNGCRGETSTVQKMQERIEHDNFYLRNWSIRLDLLIMITTIWQVLRGDEAY